MCKSSRNVVVRDDTPEIFLSLDKRSELHKEARSLGLVSAKPAARPCLCKWAKRKTRRRRTLRTSRVSFFREISFRLISIIICPISIIICINVVAAQGTSGSSSGIAYVFPVFCASDIQTGGLVYTRLTYQPEQRHLSSNDRRILFPIGKHNWYTKNPRAFTERFANCRTLPGSSRFRTNIIKTSCLVNEDRVHINTPLI